MRRRRMRHGLTAAAPLSPSLHHLIFRPCLPSAPHRYKSPGEAYVEGDASSASYFLAGATITGGTVTVEGCGSDSLQGDVRFAGERGRGSLHPLARARACGRPHGPSALLSGGRLLRPLRA